MADAKDRATHSVSEEGYLAFFAFFAEVLPVQEQIVILARKMQPRSFRVFSDRFREIVTAPDFGEPPRSNQRDPKDTQSPGAKELDRCGVLPTLTSTSYGAKLFSVVRKRWRHENDILEAFRNAEMLRAIIGEYRRAQKTLATMKRHIEAFAKEQKTGLILEYEIRDSLMRMADTLDGICQTIEQRRRLKINTLPSKLRKPTEQVEGFLPVLDLYKFELLEHPKNEADRRLREALARKFNTLKLSRQTTYKLIAAVLEAAGMAIPPTAIKQSLWRTRKGL